MIDYQEDWLYPLIFQRAGSVGLTASFYALPCALSSLLLLHLDKQKPTLFQDLGLPLVGGRQFTVHQICVCMLLGFRASWAMTRFWDGAKLLHQMRVEWLESINLCFTSSRGGGDKEAHFRHTMVRLMSLCHGSALEELSGTDVHSMDSAGLDDGTLALLKESSMQGFNKVEVLLNLMRTRIGMSFSDGTMKICPSLLGHIYSTLSRGFMNLANAKKIVDVRFPFPFAQLSAMLLLSNAIITPFAISCHMKSKLWAPIFTFLPVFTMFSVHRATVAVEQPFGEDDNAFPIGHFQTEMNASLKTLLHPNSDHVADISESRCMMDSDKINLTADD